ncbi:HlyD family secretion protein [Martelella endophytica]|uniref:HlyD family secretion protein n=1 Tax=Martelella endophytica TaxID=1486262 RepID=UPI0005F1E3F9|nr:HlyD family secretion protein [Martelella endophytica]
MTSSNEQTGAAEPLAQTRNEQPPRRHRRSGRFILMASLPVLLAVIGGYVYVKGGRVISTENAYVSQDQVKVVPQVSGEIVSVGPGENDIVEKGSLLFAIDDATYVNAVDQAKAAVASARLDVEKLKSAYLKAEAQRDTAQQARDIARTREKRQKTLLGQGAVSQTALDEADLTLRTAEGAVVSAEQDVASAKASLGGDPDIATDKHPEVMAALAKLSAAEIDLARTRVVAPADGIVTQTTSLRPGQYVSESSSVVTLVETGTTVIEANFKETELTHMRPGQPVDVTIDAYPDVTIRGTVESLGAGTGSAFSLIPAQNASGNWVKVVQRVPVRIALEPEDETPPLRVGMSALVEVDTGHARGLPDFVRSALATVGIGTTAIAAEADPR